jgi:hypothetical protein
VVNIVNTLNVVVTHTSYLSAIKYDFALITAILSILESRVINIGKIVVDFKLHSILLFILMLLAKVIRFIHWNLNLIFTHIVPSFIHRLINELLLLISIKSPDELPLMI